MKRPEKNQDGIALMVVLWILVLMTALATEFASTMKTEVGAARNYKEDVESYYLAKAGINMAMAELLKTARFHSYIDGYGLIIGKPKLVAKNQQDQKKEDESEFDIIPRSNIPLGNGTVSYTITDENGKVNLNTAQRETLINTLAASGVEKGEAQDTIADSILDWIDKDDLNRINGAETKYYQTLTPPYRPKNGRFDSVNELIRVRWVTDEMLYGSPPSSNELDGGPQYLGLNNFFTVQNTLTVNPNTAPPEILSIFYKESQLQEILNARAERGYYSDTLSTHFKVTSTGKIDHSKTSHTITAIFQRVDGAGAGHLLVRYWKDNVFQQ